MTDTLLERMLQYAKAHPQSEAQRRARMRETADGYQRLLMQHSTALTKSAPGLTVSPMYALALITDWLSADRRGEATVEAWLEATDAASVACREARWRLYPELYGEGGALT